MRNESSQHISATDGSRPVRSADQGSYFRPIPDSWPLSTLLVVLRDKIRAAWAAPRPPDAPTRVWRDWVLVGLLIPTALLEGLLRPDLTWRPLSLALIVPLALALLWRRTHPLTTALAIFVPVGLVNTYSLVTGVVWDGLFSIGALLIIVYSLGRWGSGREVVIGGMVMLVMVTVGIFSEEPVVLGDVIGGYLIVLFTFEIGIIIRSQVAGQAQRIERTRLQERELLARELHDTVAHHVSAIAIQAQAGRTLAASRPNAALDALTTIEEEASRTLTEMRSMVGALRQGAQPTYAPQPGVSDLEALAASNGSDNGDGLRVDVELAGELDDLRPAVDAAVFRMAQESITNAVRHARRATRVAVRVVGGRDAVHLTVDDDGVGSDPGGAPGYGLVGMRERAELLGGTLEAGPKTAGRGWTVRAALPRQGGVQ